MRTSLLLTPLMLLGCTSSDHHAPSDLQMNDVSVMLPLPRSQAELDAALSPTTPARGGVLFPEAVYMSDGNGGILSYSALRVVAFRLDPCFGTTDPVGEPAKCKNQLRVIFQPLGLDTPTSAVAAQDGAVHAFYSLTRDELLAATQEMIDARLADGGDADLGPLAPHPTIVREGLGGTLAQSFDHIITKYAGQGNLVQFTSFTFEGVFEGGSAAAGIDQFWTMHGFHVTNGQVTPIEIGAMPSGTTDIGLDATGMPLAMRISPQAPSVDDITLLGNFDQAMQATSAQRQAAFDSALRIENPRHHTPDTIDCGSCHMAQPSRELVGEALGMSEAGNANAFVADASIPAADLKHTTTLLAQDGQLNIHAFSYRNDAPMINQRVINETAGNVAYLAPLLR